MRSKKLTVALAVLVTTGALTTAAMQTPPTPKGDLPPGYTLGPTVGLTQYKLPPPPADSDDFKVSSEVEVVLLDVSVKGPNGGFVSGLTKENFEIWDEKEQQDITIFAAQDVPVTVGLVVDNSGSVRPKKPEIVTAALTFVTESNPKDEMFVVNFNDRVFMGLPSEVPFTGDPRLLREALLTNPAQGRTSLNDAIKSALEHIELGRLDKKTLVVVSDGGDNASQLLEDELISRIEHSLATIYTVGIYNPEDKDKNPGFLKKIARISGGEYYRPENTSHLVGVCQQIAKDIRNRYTIGFSPKTSSPDGKKRRLRIVARNDEGRQLEVRTRTHYMPMTGQNQAPSKGE